MAGSKHRWTAEEEAAFKDGISKHGVGRWSAILKDPEFQTVLHNRSNVDLKDKWRNMQPALTGVQRPKHARRRDISKQEGKSVVSSNAGNDNKDEIALEASQEDKWKNMQQASTGVQRPKHVRRAISKQEGKSVASPDAGNDNEDEIALEASQEDKWKNVQQASTGVQRPKHVGRDISKQEGKSVASTDAGNSTEDEIALEASQEDKWRNMQQASTGVQRPKHVRRDISKQKGKSVASTDAGNDNEDEIALVASQEDKWRNMQRASTGVQRPKHVRRDSKQEGKSVASTDAGNDNEDEIALEASQEVDEVMMRIMQMNPQEAAAAAAIYVEKAKASMAAAEEAEEEAAAAQLAAERAEANAAEIRREIEEKKASTQPAAPTRRPRSSHSRRRRTYWTSA